MKKKFGIVNKPVKRTVVMKKPRKTLLRHRNVEDM
jgi:hypothetical protein